MAKCVFCGEERPSSTGVFLLKNTGEVHFFCSSKCRKNALKLKRDKRRLKWTEAYRVLKEKGIVKEAKEKEDKRLIEEKDKKDKSLTEEKEISK